MSIIVASKGNYVFAILVFVFAVIGRTTRGRKSRLRVSLLESARPKKDQGELAIVS
jgi:hypothetical protein